MAFGYLIGVALFGILYCFGMKIFYFFNPEPEIPPCEKEFDTLPEVCVLTINGKVFKAIKKEHIRKDYYYSGDCDILQHSAKHRIYDLENPICYDDMIDKNCLTCEVKDGDMLIKCYDAVDRKTLISCEPETEERVYSYRKPFRRKKISA